MYTINTFLLLKSLLHTIHLFKHVCFFPLSLLPGSREVAFKSKYRTTRALEHQKQNELHLAFYFRHALSFPKALDTRYSSVMRMRLHKHSQTEPETICYVWYSIFSGFLCCSLPSSLSADESFRIEDIRQEGEVFHTKRQDVFNHFPSSLKCCMNFSYKLRLKLLP